MLRLRRVLLLRMLRAMVLTMLLARRGLRRRRNRRRLRRGCGLHRSDLAMRLDRVRALVAVLSATTTRSAAIVAAVVARTCLRGLSQTFQRARWDLVADQFLDLIDIFFVPGRDEHERVTGTSGAA